jgi:hypothetical protein
MALISQRVAARVIGGTLGKRLAAGKPDELDAILARVPLVSSWT